MVTISFSREAHYHDASSVMTGVESSKGGTAVTSDGRRVVRTWVVVVLTTVLCVVYYSTTATTFALSSTEVVVSSAKKQSTSPEQGNDSSIQSCLDQFTGHGFWEKDKWVARTSLNCQWLLKDPSAQDLRETFRNVKVGFSGDSTTRSDLRAFEETLGLRKQTNWDEAQIFQKLNKRDGSYICAPEEQSINLTKCGIPPIVNTTNFRYVYKVYPFTPLDRWYFRENADAFRELDVFVVSVGAWTDYQPWSAREIARSFHKYLHELRKVFSGQIIFQTEYPFHDAPANEVKATQSAMMQETCPHGFFYFDEVDNSEPYDCVQSVTTEKPERMNTLRRVAEAHGIPYVDRWDLTKTLPLEYYQSWLCNEPTFHQWDCNHHLSFVGLLHVRTVVNIIRNLAPNWSTLDNGFHTIAVKEKKKKKL